MVPIFHPLEWVELSETPAEILERLSASAAVRTADRQEGALDAGTGFSVNVEVLGVSTEVVFTVSDGDQKFLGWTINFPIDQDEDTQAGDVGGALYQRVAEQLGEAEDLVITTADDDEEFVALDARWWPEPSRCLRIWARNKEGPRQASRASLQFSLFRDAV